MGKKGIIKIHGKEYKTVALRVNEFREKFSQEYGIETDLINSSDLVIVKATIKDEKGFVVASGYAEEVRGSTMINKTSALENCETSAIGRALACFGFAGEEYASANEVQSAIHQQKRPTLPRKLQAPYQSIREHFDAGDLQAVGEGFSEFGRIEEQQAVQAQFNSKERAEIAKFIKSDKYNKNLDVVKVEHLGSEELSRMCGEFGFNR